MSKLMQVHKVHETIKFHVVPRDCVDVLGVVHHVLQSLGW